MCKKKSTTGNKGKSVLWFSIFGVLLNTGLAMTKDDAKFNFDFRGSQMFNVNITNPAPAATSVVVPPSK